MRYYTHQRASAFTSCPACSSDEGVRVQSNKPLSQSEGLAKREGEGKGKGGGAKRPPLFGGRLGSRCSVGCRGGVIEMSVKALKELEALEASAEKIAYAKLAVKAWREAKALGVI